jgi:hypothetical protein
MATPATLPPTSAGVPAAVRPAMKPKTVIMRSAISLIQAIILWMA